MTWIISSNWAVKRDSHNWILQERAMRPVTMLKTILGRLLRRHCAVLHVQKFGSGAYGGTSTALKISGATLIGHGKIAMRRLLLSD